VRYGDLALLALALPIFIAAGWPLVGYAAAAAAWVAQHLMIVFSGRASRAALAAGERNRALGIVGATTLGRVWLVAMAILLVGLLGEREDGLAAAVLTLALVTVHLGCLASSKLLYPEEDAR
jgi:L-asparagine transporter-like permease